MTVKATREGLVGGLSASGYVIDEIVHFVALPCRAALGRHVRLTNPANGKTTIAQVLDVGPHLQHDHEYVFEGKRPKSEAGFKTVRGQVVPAKTNGAGIDLGEAVWQALGMTDNGPVEWEFV